MNESIEQLVEKVLDERFDPIEGWMMNDEVDSATLKARIITAINQAREADRWKIEGLERDYESLKDAYYGGSPEPFMQKIHQLESKVLELTEALEYAKKHDPVAEWMDTGKTDGTHCALIALKAEQALSTTPATEIRERIRAEVVEEFLAQWDKKYSEIDPNKGYREHKEGIQYGMVLAEEIAQSIKKGGTL